MMNVDTVPTLFAVVAIVSLLSGYIGECFQNTCGLSQE